MPAATASPRSTDGATAPPARLLIQAGPVAGRGWLSRRLAGLGAWLAAWRGKPGAQAARVQIDDLGGRRYFASEDARPCIDLPLPAGTYHVSVRVGALQRRYTVALEQGATVTLALPPVHEQAAERA